MARGTEKKEAFIEWMTTIPHLTREDAEIIYHYGFRDRGRVLTMDVVDLAAMQRIGFIRGKEIKKGIVEYIGTNREECDRYLGGRSSAAAGSEPTSPLSPPPKPSPEKAPSAAGQGMKKVSGSISSIFKKGKSLIPKRKAAPEGEKGTSE